MTHECQDILEKEGYMPIPEGFTPVSEATQKWGKSRAYWYNVAKFRMVPTYTFPGEGRQLFFRDTEVETYLTTPQSNAPFNPVAG